MEKLNPLKPLLGKVSKGRRKQLDYVDIYFN